MNGQAQQHSRGLRCGPASGVECAAAPGRRLRLWYRVARRAGESAPERQVQAASDGLTWSHLSPEAHDNTPQGEATKECSSAFVT